SVSGSCSTSTSSPGGASSKNRIPTVGNPNPAGPVAVKVNPPATSGCTVNVPGTSASVVTSGTWKISVQHRPTSVKATMTIPQAGAVVTTTGIASCTATVAPSAKAKVIGSFTNGSPSTLSFNSVTLPVSVTGASPCPTSVTSAQLTVTYEIK